MESATSNGPVSGLRQSSVVPGQMTREGNDRELTNLDLALKLHYIKGVYFFSRDAAQGLTIEHLKVPMFVLLTRYNSASGRIRRGEKTGRPFIKCNDSGVRILEGYCDKTLEEWLGIENVQEHDNGGNFQEHRVALGGHIKEFLACDGVLGPDLAFSPLVYVQFTKFKCGGLAIGLSWAHVLGDPISVSAFINTWAQQLQGQTPLNSLHPPGPWAPELPRTAHREPFFLKRVEPKGDHWLPTSNPNMKSHSFHLTPKQLSTILSGPTQKAASYFQVLSALVWKSVSRARGDLGPKTVTICTVITQGRELEAPCNKVVFGVVQADSPVEEVGVHELAVLIGENQQEENSLVDGLVGGSRNVDYMAYGTKLTFVNMEGANIYGAELSGHKPVFVNYNIDGVGEEGAVLVLPGPGGGRTLTVTLPEEQLVELKNELGSEWGIA